MVAKLGRRLLASVVVLVLVSASVVSVSAQGTVTAAPANAGSTFTGKVSKTSPFTVNSNGQDRVVNPGPSVAVTRDGKAAQLSDIKAGDQVNVTTNPDGTLARVETTNTGGGFPAWLIPLIIALLLIGLIAALLSRRKKDSFVLERNNGTTTNTRTTETRGTTDTRR